MTEQSLEFFSALSPARCGTLGENERQQGKKTKSRASDGCHIVSAKHFGLIEYVSSFTDACIKYGSANVKSCIMLKQIWLNISINK